MENREITLGHIADLTAYDAELDARIAECKADFTKAHFLPTYEHRKAQNLKNLTKLQTAL